MEGVATEKAPSIGVVVPHFVAAGLWFFVVSILILVSATSFQGHFYTHHLLGITHMTALGWITMIIFGVLYQLIPVVFETALFSEKIAKINLPIYFIGLSGMVYAFWVGDFERLLPWFSSLTYIALILFSINVLLSVRSANQKKYGAKFIVTGIIWLLLTATLGLLMALNHKFSFLDASGFRLLKTHAHLGMIGWFVQLIFGIASVLVPMFLVAHNENERKLKFSYYLINAGLLLLSLSWIFDAFASLIPIFGAMIAMGVIVYLLFLNDIYKTKIRKLDIGMKLTSISFASIIIPFLLGIGLSFYAHPPSNISLLYGFSVFFAFITPLILGQTYKTLPFIVWLNRYQPHVGKMKIPMPADLYSDKLAHAHMWTYLVAIIMLIFGIFLSTEWLIQIGAMFLMVTAFLYFGNMISILTHKMELEPLFIPKTKDNDFLEILKGVIDPEVEINIVDMGLIYKLEYDGDKKVDIEMTLSTPNCPVGDSIVMSVMEAILSKHPDYDVNVHLVFEPKWTPDRISVKGREMLGEGHRWS